jgi:hypothetical protein
MYICISEFIYAWCSIKLKSQQYSCKCMTLDIKNVLFKCIV